MLPFIPGMGMGFRGGAPDWLNNLGQGAADVARGVMGPGLDHLGEIPGAIGSAAGKVGSMLKNVPQDVGMGVAGGLGGAAPSIISGIASALGYKSPFQYL